MSAALEHAPAEVPTLDARIRIDRFVAEGGFGRVYKGHHRTLDRDVAIKVLKVPAEYGDVARAMFCERFAQEARIIARLDHPAVVRVLDFGVAAMPDGEAAPYMILDWLDGVTLKDLIAARHREGGAFDRDETLRLLTPVMEAVAMAHAQGIVHRDITPGNLMLVETAAGPSLRLLDFGIAKVMEEGHGGRADEPEDTQTHTALLAFSPRWAAPEQAGRGRTGPWTDVHALGLLCTAMLTGQRPYRGTREALFREIFSEPRPTPAAFGVDVGAWEPVLSRALSLRTEARQPDAGALLRELQDAVFASAPTRVVTVPASVRAAAIASAPPVPVPVPVPAASAPRVSPTVYAIGGAVAALVLVALGLSVTARRAPAAPPVATAPVSLPAVRVDLPVPQAPSLAPAPAPALAPTPAPALAQTAPQALPRRSGGRRAAVVPAFAAPAARVTEPAPEPVMVAPTTEPPPSRRRIEPVRSYP